MEFSDIFTTTSPSIIALCICTWIGYVKFKQLLWPSCMYKQWVNLGIVKPDSVFGNYAHLMFTASEYCEYFWNHLLYWVHVATLLSIFRITFAFMIPQILHNNNNYYNEHTLWIQANYRWSESYASYNWSSLWEYWNN